MVSLEGTSLFDRNEIILLGPKMEQDGYNSEILMLESNPNYQMNASGRVSCFVFQELHTECAKSSFFGGEVLIYVQKNPWK